MLRRSAAQASRLCLASLARASRATASSGIPYLHDDRTSSSSPPPHLPQLSLPLAYVALLQSNSITTSASAYSDETGPLTPPELPPTELEVILQADRVAEAAAFVAAKADAYLPTQFFINILDFMHLETMWPWWTVIAGTNIAVRLASMPISIFTQKQSAKMVAVNQDMAEMKELQAAATRATDHKQYEAISKQLTEKQVYMMQKHGKTLKMAMVMPVMSLLNGAIFISLFAALNRLATEKVPSMVHGGTLWFTDLTVPDPYFGIPIFCCLVTLAMVEFGAMSSEMAMPPETMKKMSWFLRFIAFAFIPAGQYVPSGVGVLWVSNSLFGIFQSVLFRLKATRKMLGLPDMKAAQELMASSKGVLGLGGGSSAPVAGIGGAVGGGAAAVAAGGELKPPPPRPTLLNQRPRVKRK